MSTPTNGPTFTPAPVNAPLVIRKLTPAMTIFSVPFSRFNFMRVGGRSTAVKLKNNDVLVVASHPLCAETHTTLAQLGPVSTLFSPDLEHTMYLEQYALAYPTAKILAPQSTIARLSTKESIKGRISSDFKSLETQYPGELKICDFKDSFRNEDVAILVVEEKTLIQADLLFNLPATEQYSKTGISASVPILNSFSAGSKFHKAALWYALVSNKQIMKRDAGEVAGWDFSRIIPCHGDVIEGTGKQAWIDTYAQFLDGKN